MACGPGQTLRDWRRRSGATGEGGGALWGRRTASLGLGWGRAAGKLWMGAWRPRVVISWSSRAAPCGEGPSGRPVGVSSAAVGRVLWSWCSSVSLPRSEQLLLHLGLRCVGGGCHLSALRRLLSLALWVQVYFGKC